MDAADSSASPARQQRDNHVDAVDTGAIALSNDQGSAVGRSNEENTPLSFSALGIPAYSKTQASFTGQVRTLKSIKRNEWIYFALSCLSLLSSFVMTIVRMTTLDPKSDDFTFAILLLFTILFCFWYVIHGILKERPYEIMVFVAGTCIVMIYSLLNYVYSVSPREILKTIRLAFAFILGPLIIVGGLYLSKLYYEANDFILRTLGSTVEAVSMGRKLFLFTSLLKFDLQLGTSMIILIMKNGTAVDKEEVILLSVSAVTFLAWTTLGYFAVRFENKILAAIFLATSLLSPALTAYKLNILYQENSKILQSCIIACGVVGLMIRLAIIICLILVMKNFNKGIKEKLYGRRS